MDVMLRDKAEELAKEIAVSISTQQELSDVMRLMTKSVTERTHAFSILGSVDIHLAARRAICKDQRHSSPHEKGWQGCRRYDAMTLRMNNGGRLNTCCRVERVALEPMPRTTVCL